jgi:predicted RNA-binding Zn ribbon-like protein
MVYRTRTLETLEIIGGSLCLDFANTINSRRKPEYDYLAKYSDLANWAVKVGALSTSQGKLLRKQADQDDANAWDALQKAVSLRELLYRLFSKLAKQFEPAQEDMSALVKLYADTISHGVFLRKGECFTVDWEVDAKFDAILWPIIYSSGQLLLSEKLMRVKECPNCGWLFIDTSKNQNRRWCSMNTCGARDKMRRYHRKLRE